jgi:Glu-tRNA(Gln) amidotransferase subunit E-like FAD-binding protein
MACALGMRPRAWGPPARRRASRRPHSLIRATLARHGARALTRSALVEVELATASAIVAENGGRVWCVRYPGLAGAFRKDRGPSKALGRVLCDEVRTRFACGGFLTTDELPRYGIGRAARRAILDATGAGPADCVVVYAHPEALARAADDHLHARLIAMA